MLPNGWKKIKLGEICNKIGSGSTPKGGREVYLNAGIPIIRSQNVLNGFLDLNDVAFISDEQHSKMKGTWVHPNDILLNITGASIGRSCVVPATVKTANVNQHVCIIRLKECADACYVCNLILSKDVQKQIELLSVGGGRQGLNFQQIASFSFLLPPIEEQKKIAATLSLWDSAIEKMEKLIDAKEDQKKSLIWKLIENTDAIRKEKIKIDDLFDEVCEKNHPDADVLTIIQGTGTLLREKSGRDIVYDKKSLSNYKFVKKGDFIIHLRSFEGGLEVANQDGIVSPAYIILRPKIEVSTDYLYALFHTNRFINYTISPAVEGARDGRSVKYDALKKQFINLPTFSEQKYIAKIITTAEKEHSLLKQQLENYKKQKQGLMQKLLTGQWRVK